MIILGIILIGTGLYLCYYAWKRIQNVNQVDQEIADHNKLLLNEQRDLIDKKHSLQEQNKLLLMQVGALQEQAAAGSLLAQQSFEAYCDGLENEYLAIENSFDERKKLLEKTHDLRLQQLEDAYEHSKKETRAAFNAYITILENEYGLAESEFDDKINSFKTDLDNLKQTYTAAREAQLRAEELEQKADFYSLHLTATEKYSISLIEELKTRLPDPRVLCMLIWSTYYQKQMTSLCNNVLGAGTVCGIYKITNKISGLCYIGQAVDIATRWKTHAKCGLGIDTPAQNKLYRAMLKDGLTNFTFELLERCDKSLLNEKEKFYIDLYQAYEYGYNSNSGNNNK